MKLLKRNIEKLKNKLPGAKSILFCTAVILFIAGSILLILKGTSGASSTENTTALNYVMPDGKIEDIEKDKIKALRKVDSRHNEDIAGEVVGDISFDDTAADSFTAEPATASIQSYKQLSSQLQGFNSSYNDDHKVRDLQKEIELLKDDLRKTRNPEIDPSAILEQSYAMASKLLEHNSAPALQVQEVTDLKEIMKVRTVSLGSSTVSGLSGLTTKDMLDESRKYDFITAVGAQSTKSSNTISACIDQQQTITTGSPVKIRLRESILVGESIIPQNSVLTGTAILGNNQRLEIGIEAIEFQGAIFPVELIVHDQDGQKGLFIPTSSERNAVKDAAGAMTNSFGSSISISRDAKQQVAMDATRGIITGGTQYLSSKIKEVRVTLKPDYKILLISRN